MLALVYSERRYRALFALADSFENIVVLEHRYVLEYKGRNVVSVLGFQLIALFLIPVYYLRIKRLISTALCVSSAVEKIEIKRGAFAVGGQDRYVICSASVDALRLLAHASGQGFVYLFKLVFVAYPDLPVVVAESDGERDVPVGHGL